MARIIITRNFYSYYITKSPTLDIMDKSILLGIISIVCICGLTSKLVVAQLVLAVDEPPCLTFISMYILCFGGITVITLLNLHH